MIKEMERKVDEREREASCERKRLSLSRCALSIVISQSVYLCSCCSAKSTAKAHKEMIRQNRLSHCVTERITVGE